MSVDENGTVSIDALANDVDLNNDSLSITSVGAPINGQAEIEEDGTILYTPNNDFFGSDNFIYTVSDGNGGETTATITVTVNEIVPEPEVFMEFGSIAVDHNAVTVQLDHVFENPIVFVTMTSFNGAQIAVPRITDVTADSFTFYTQETNSLDGWHGVESYSYIVLEQGSWALEDGTLIEAGLTTLADQISAGWDAVSFDTDFDDRPAIFSQVQSQNGGDFVVMRHTAVDENGFAFGMQEEEALADTMHREESVGWLAVETGASSAQGHDFYADSLDSFSHEWSDIMFNDHLDELPQLLTSLSSTNGANTATVRVDNLDEDGASLMVQEDQSLDSEVDHYGETIDVFAIEGSGQLLGVKQDNSDIV